MKLFPTQLLTFGFGLGLLAAADEADPKAAPGDQVQLTVVIAEGGGWGASQAVRAAVASQIGVESILLSGTRATVIMEEGEALVEAEVKAAIEAKRLTFVSLETKTVPRPKAAYVLAAAGSSWAATNDKARAALEKLEGVANAFVNKDIMLLFNTDEAPDKEALAKALEPFEMKLETMEKAPKLPF